MESAAVVETPICQKESMVDPFLVEALQNPRHRLTILRMELDIQRFLQNPDQQQFEFQHFPTSYLRLAAHRVAQHYGLITTVLESGLDGSGNRILVIKHADRRHPSVRLSEIPAKQSENDRVENVKIAIKPRPFKGSASDANDLEKKRGPLRSVEERKEEYDRARARIFNNPSSPESDDSMPEPSVDEKSTSLVRDEIQAHQRTPMEAERNFSLRESGNSIRVAILRDREKDQFDPDYDRSYERYGRNLRFSQNFGLAAPFNLQKGQPPLYDAGFPQFGQAPINAASIYNSPHGNSVMNPYAAMGLNQTPADVMYLQWPNTMMYAHSYDQFRHAPLQAQYRQQPLSFDYAQNR